MHESKPAPASERELSRTERLMIPPRRSRWILITIVAAIAIGATIPILWIKTGMPAEEARPGIDQEVSPTTGEHPIDEPIPGASSGPTAVNDFNYVDLTVPVARGETIAYLDRQALYVVEPTPVEMRDTEMIIEGLANEESDAPKYKLYVPAATSSAADKSDAARYYYLKVGENKYLKVTLQPMTP